MSDPRTINPFAGCPVIFTYLQHIDAGLLGGTDYLVKPAVGFLIRAASDGTVTRISASEARLTVSPTLRYNYRELLSFTTGAVLLGEPFGFSGRLMPNGVTRYGPHIDAERKINGRWVREPFEPHVNSTLTNPAGGESTPLVERRKSMTTIYVKSSTGATGGAGSTWALAGDVGTPCAGNWIEFVRNPADQGNQDRGYRMTLAHGNGIFLNDTDWATYKAAYTTEVGGGAGGQYVDAQFVDDGELGGALTSAVQLINDHTDQKFAEQFV